jgi:hypothetical protein
LKGSSLCSPEQDRKKIVRNYLIDIILFYFKKCIFYHKQRTEISKKIIKKICYTTYALKAQNRRNKKIEKTSARKFERNSNKIRTKFKRNSNKIQAAAFFIFWVTVGFYVIMFSLHDRSVFALIAILRNFVNVFFLFLFNRLFTGELSVVNLRSNYFNQIYENIVWRN